MKRVLPLLLVAAGCSRDLTTPPLPQPGRLFGRTVYAVPGRSDPRPAALAVVSLLGSGLSTTANQAGTFSLGPVEETQGVLHFSFDSDGDGRVDRQRVERLEDWKAGVNRQVDMGDVALGENAGVRGKVLLADRPGAKSGLSGSAVFVPEGPFAAYTADDGSFVLPNLPEGPLQFYVFRAGYNPRALGTVPLRAGEDYLFRDVVLTINNEPMLPGSIVGGFVFSPDALGKGDTAITAQALSAAPVSGTVDASLAFRFPSLSPGLYTLTATRTGYTRARVFNVLVLPNKESSVGVVLLTDQPEADGGQLPSTDGGGPGDAGPCVGPNCTACMSNAQCTATQWCDNFFCVPQCSSVVPCTNGRACDSATNTCVIPCSPGCPANLICENNICRAACDGSFRCDAGFICNAQNSCVPECATAAPCVQANLTCVAGQCVPVPTGCANDLDCPADMMCLLAKCVPRPTGRLDGGPFVCPTVCDCKLGEWCTGGLCLPDSLPTHFFSTDGGGGGTSMLAPSSELRAKLSAVKASDRFALRAGDRFYAELGFGLDSGSVSLVGGYVVCGANRWIRSEAGRTTLATDGGLVLIVNGTSLAPIDDVRVANLELETAADYGCDEDALFAQNTRRLDVSRVDGARSATTDCSFVGTNALLQCSSCQQLSVTDVRLKDSSARNNNIAVVNLGKSDGLLRRISADRQTAVHRTFGLIQSTAQIGPLQIQDSKLPEITSNAGAFGVAADQCFTLPLIIERSTFLFTRATPSPTDFAASVYANRCNNVQVRDNLFDGTLFVGALFATSSAVELIQSGGVVERNVIRLPRTPSSTRLRGVFFESSVGAVTVRDNTITGGSSADTVEGIRSGTNSLPVLIAGNQIDVGPGQTVRGISAGLTTGGLRITDNFSRATGNKLCGSRAVGLDVFSSPGAAERNRLFGQGAATNLGAELANTSQAELYSNHLWAGVAECSGQGIALLVVNSAQAYLNGNTLDVEGLTGAAGASTGVRCDNSSLFADANVIGSGRASTRRILTLLTAGCRQPINYTRNYFWHDALASGINPADDVFVVTDGGTPDARGNFVVDQQSPFDPAQPQFPDGGALPRHRLSPTSAAINRGAVPKRADTTEVWLDLDARPRDAGASADLGCCERY